MATIYVLLGIFGALLQVSYCASLHENYQQTGLTKDLSLPFILRTSENGRFTSDLEELADFSVWEVPDTCQNISKALTELKGATSKASALIGEIASTLSSTWKNSFNCITPYLPKAVTCMVETMKGYKDAYNKYKPQIVDMKVYLGDEFTKFYVVIEDCLANLVP